LVDQILYISRSFYPSNLTHVTSPHLEILFIKLIDPSVYHIHAASYKPTKCNTVVLGSSYAGTVTSSGMFEPSAADRCVLGYVQSILLHQIQSSPPVE